MSDTIIISGSVIPSQTDTLLDKRTKVATFADIANIENPARFLVITVEDTGRKYEVKKLTSKVIGGVTVPNATIDINDPDALEDLGLAEELRAEEEAVRQKNEAARVVAEKSRVQNEDEREEAETQRSAKESTRQSNENIRQGNENSRIEAETARLSAESIRQTNESTRKSNESARQTAEESRVSAEDSRKQAESARASEEVTRQNNEAARKVAETNRVTAEDERATSESSRKSAESTRVSNENARKEAETLRVNAENSREQAEGNRATTFNTLKGEMETTISEGETATANANAAAESANEVVENYDTKVAEQDAKLTELGSKVEELNNISESNEDGFFVTDEQGNVALSVNEKGETNFSPSEELIYKLNKKGFVSESNEDGFFVTDEQGNVALKLTEEDGFEAAIYERPELDVEPADIYHIITYGQSLSCGFESFPIQSNTQKYDSLMFNTGVIYDMADSIDKITDFVPLTEQKYGNQGETPCSGVSEGLVESFVKYTGMKRRGFQLLLSACGVGGANINTLMQESYLQRVYDVIDKGRAIASQKGKTYKVMAVLWMQGEANASAYDADNESYKQNLKQILNSINSYAKSATGQIMDVENFAYLPCTNANPAVAIYELCKDTETNLTCCGAIYREKQNKIHLLGAASYSYGYRCGVAMFKKVFLNKAVKNVHPLKHYVDGNNIYITFAADKYPVQLSNYLLRWLQSSLTDDVSIVDGGNNVDFATDKSNYGFSIKNSEGNEIITEVSVSRYDTIKIVCSESPIGCTMLYACKPYLLHHEGNSPIGSRIYGGVCDSGNLKISTSDGIENLISVCVPFYVNL